MNLLCCVLSSCSKDALGKWVKKSQWKEIGKSQSPGHLHHTPRWGLDITAESTVMVAKQSILKRKLSVFLTQLEISKPNFFFNIVEHKGFDLKWHHLYGKLDERTQTLRSDRPDRICIPLLAVWSYSSYLSFLSLSFTNCEMMIIMPTFKNGCENSAQYLKCTLWIVMNFPFLIWKVRGNRDGVLSYPHPSSWKNNDNIYYLFIYSFIHSFIQEICIEYLLYAGSCFRH